jgi:hypothetical protein
LLEVAGLDPDPDTCRRVRRKLATSVVVALSSEELIEIGWDAGLAAVAMALLVGDDPSG